METKRAGLVGVFGRSNVGKSTLISRILGQKVLPISPKPQTTRRRQLGILTEGNVQIVFVDTPGIHTPLDRFGIYLNELARHSVRDVDVILWVADASVPPGAEETMVTQFLSSLSAVPVILVLNKMDLLKEGVIEERKQMYLSLLPRAEPVEASALTGQGLTELLEKLKALLPEKPFEYPEDIPTDLTEREIAAELITEAVLLHVYEELPYSCAVRLDEFKERDAERVYILATIFVEKESQKPILIGSGGRMIRAIGITARREIEALTGKKVYLDLRVKVLKNWRRKDECIRMLFKTSQ